MLTFCIQFLVIEWAGRMIAYMTGLQFSPASGCGLWLQGLTCSSPFCKYLNVMKTKVHPILLLNDAMAWCPWLGHAVSVTQLVVMLWPIISTFVSTVTHRYILSLHNSVLLIGIFFDILISKHEDTANMFSF